MSEEQLQTVDNTQQWVEGVWESDPFSYGEDGAEIAFKLDLSWLVEKLGQMIDTCDNYAAYKDNNFMPPSMKVDALLHGMKELREGLFELHQQFGGENHWEERDGN